ncbi:MAG: acyltransferase family protein [Collinsella sp.]
MQPKAARNIPIEALRLIAVAGIAVFHTFQWTFQGTCVGLQEYTPLAAFPYSGALGFINLLGCWANEVFFMTSGYFLIPSAVRALQKGSSVHDLTRKSLARLQKIVFPTLFYCAACLLVSMYIYPLPEISLHEIGWLTLGIEFIWVYAASVLLVPVIVLARRQIGSKRAPFVVALLVLATFGINCYIAATANEAAGIVLWRKLMSAVTYLVAFIAAGEMRFALGHCNKTSAAQKSKIVLIGLIAATIALELLLSAGNQLWHALDALLQVSFTSPILHCLGRCHRVAAAQPLISCATRPQPQTRQSRLSPRGRHWVSMPYGRFTCNVSAAHLRQCNPIPW